MSKSIYLLPPIMWLNQLNKNIISLTFQFPDGRPGGGGEPPLVANEPNPQFSLCEPGDDGPGGGGPGFVLDSEVEEMEFIWNTW